MATLWIHKWQSKKSYFNFIFKIFLEYFSWNFPQIRLWEWSSHIWISPLFKTPNFYFKKKNSFLWCLDFYWNRFQFCLTCFSASIRLCLCFTLLFVFFSHNTHYYHWTFSKVHSKSYCVQLVQYALNKVNEFSKASLIIYVCKPWQQHFMDFYFYFSYCYAFILWQKQQQHEQFEQIRQPYVLLPMYISHIFTIVMLIGFTNT